MTSDHQYNVQSTYDNNVSYPNNFTHIKHSYTNADGLIHTDLDSDILDVDDPNKFHIEIIPHYTAPTRDQQQAWEPSSFTFECVANTMPCTAFINETHPCSGPDNCDQPDEISASLETSKCPVDATIVDNDGRNANALWDSNNNVWDVSTCTKCQPNDNTEITSANCYGSATMLLDTSNDNINTVHTTLENIIFTDTGQSEVICSRCLPDENDGTKYYLKEDNQHPTYDYYGASNTYTVHACTKSDGTKTGYYRDETNGGCNMTSGSWEESLNGLPCKLTACPAGKTATGLPIGVDSCKYSNQTKFCDAKGCFQMADSELTQWGLN